MITLTGINKRHGNQILFVDASLQLNPGEKVGLTGPNGAGKSTVFRLIVGEEKPDEGEVALPKRLTLGYFRQDMGEMSGRSVLDEAIAGSGKLGSLHHEIEQLQRDMSDPAKADDMDRILARYGEIQGEYQDLGGYELEARSKEVLHGLGFHDDQIEGDVGALSGGWKMRVGMAKVLLGNFDVLLLDEPTNHLDVDTIRWLEETLHDYKGTVVIITHDRFFLDNVVGWMLEIWHGKAIPYQGNYSEYLIQRSKRMGMQEQSEQKRAKFLDRELEWIRMNPKARTTKNKARLNNYDKMLLAEVEERDDTVELHIPAGKRLGDTVIRFEKVNFAYDKEHNVVENLSFEMQPGDILGLVGPNGTGKTTCLKLITGKLTPDAGRVVVGQTVELCHSDQERETLDPTKTVWQEITDSQDLIKLGKHEINSRSYVAKFNFTGQDQQQLVGSLSGGQRNRVQLAKMLRRGGNVILLDEPTNDLDLDTLRVLEEGIQEFPGSMVVVSHDRYFLDRICTKIIDLGHYEPGKYLDSL